jgi:hypothetical protein
MSPWLTLAGLGAFHGLNPAMGWLFAVALGLHRGSRGTVWISLIPIALGHLLSITAVVLGVLALGMALDEQALKVVAGIALLGWAAWHVLYGHRHRVRVGMQAGLAGLCVWSFSMATAHGAGLMLLPVVLPLCAASAPAAGPAASGSLPVSLAAVGVHTASMLAVTGAIAALVYEWLGLAFLRRGWINLDYLWTAALAAAGLFLLA